MARPEQRPFLRDCGRRALLRLSAVAGLIAGFSSVVGLGGEGPSAEPSAVSRYDLAGWLDAEFAKHWQEAGIEVPRCDDATYLRRVFLDLQGRIPSVPETREFLRDPNPDKRATIVDRLIVDEQFSGRNSERHAEHLARTWRRMMIPSGGTNALRGRQFEAWLTRQFRENVPYDELARRLLTARGPEETQAAAFYAAVGGLPEAYADAFSRVFLGTQIGCAQCHDHPFTDWTQSDFWGLAAFFSGTTLGSPGQPFAGGPIDERHATTITDEGVEYVATFLGGGPADIPRTRLPRELLAQWMTTQSADFPATVANRVWQHLCGRGLVRDVDNLDLASPDRRELLDELARRFVDSGHDLRWLVSGICKSRVYQCPTVGPEDREASPFAGRRPLKTLTPEQVFDSLEQALLLPVTRSNAESARHNGLKDQMVARLDESTGSAPEEYGAGIPQVLMLINGRVTADATSLDRSRTLRAVIESPFLEAEDRIDTLYLATLTRLPTARERSFMLAHVMQKTSEEDRRLAYSEIFWALLNSPEFVLCR